MRLASDLPATATDLEWIVDSYVVIYASLLLPGGALGDRLGRKGLFMVGVGLFGLGSAAPTIAVLLAGRLIQGSVPPCWFPAA